MTRTRSHGAVRKDGPDTLGLNSYAFAQFTFIISTLDSKLPRSQFWLAVVIASFSIGLAGLGLLFKTDLPPGLASIDALNLVLLAGIFGATTYITGRHIIARYRIEPLWTVVFAVIDALLLILLEQSSRLDSPFFAFWLIAIVIAGAIGAGPLTITALTTLGYAGLLWSTHGLASTLGSSWPPLAATLAALSLSSWIRYRSQTSQATRAQADQISAQLSESQLKDETLMRSMGEGVVVVDTARRIKLFNQALSAMTGWTEADTLNLNVNTILKLQDASDQLVTDANDGFSSAWQTGKTEFRDNLFVLTKNQKKLTVSVSTSPIWNQAHQISGGIAVIRDITTQKEAERLRSEFISTASHEMRTPVATIEGYLSLALNPKSATIDARAQGYLNKAHEAAVYLGSLFHDLLNVTQIEDNRVSSHPVVFNLSDTVKQVTDDLRLQAEQHGLKLLMLASSANDAKQKLVVPIYNVTADPERIHEVLQNLIDNAIKYSTSGSITVSLSKDGEMIVTTVADQGIGIPEENQAHLFEKFYRVDSSATRTIGGTGLGLFIARRLIEIYGGRIWVESKPGQGAKFSFSLPVAKTT